MCKVGITYNPPRTARIRDNLDGPAETDRHDMGTQNMMFLKLTALSQHTAESLLPNDAALNLLVPALSPSLPGKTLRRVLATARIAGFLTPEASVLWVSFTGAEQPFLRY